MKMSSEAPGKTVLSSITILFCKPTFTIELRASKINVKFGFFFVDWCWGSYYENITIFHIIIISTKNYFIFF